MGGTCSTRGRDENPCIRNGRNHSKERRRWEDNIRMDVKEIDWIHMPQGRNQWRTLVDTIMNLRVP